ncbi:hypothetical protein ACHQM5_014612 [Ranunculus cassubicifolius]
MSSLSHFIPFITVIFLLLHPTTSSDFLAPLLSPFIDELCKDILCGKGKCKSSFNHTIGYKCECDPGWKQSLSNDGGDHLGFLPCVIPNCTVDYSCMKAETPAPQMKDPPKNNSLFDPCNWAYCGEGSCTKSNKSSHICDCKQGSSNLFNQTSFPCFTDCSLGADCVNLGLTLPNRASPPAPVLSDKNDNHASSVLPGRIVWMVILLLTVALEPWK